MTPSQLHQHTIEVGFVLLILFAIIGLNSLVSVNEAAAWLGAQVYFFANLSYHIYKGTLTTERVMELVLLTAISLFVLLSIA